MSDEGVLASCSECVKVWNPSADDAPVATFAPHKKTINALRWTGHSRCVATASDDGSVVVSKKTGGAILTLGPTRNPLRCLAFLPGRKVIAAGGADRMLRLWSVGDGRVVQSLAAHSDPLTCVDAAAVGDVHCIASGDAAGVVALHTGGPTTSTAMALLRTLTTPDSAALHALAFDRHRRDQALLFSTDGGLVAEWDLQQSISGSRGSAPLWSIRAHQAACTAFAYSPVSRSLLASVGLDKRLVLISPLEQKVIKVLTLEAPLTALDFHSDGHTLAVGTATGMVFIYDLRSSSSPRTHSLKAHAPNPVTCLQFLKLAAPRATAVAATTTAAMPSTHLPLRRDAPAAATTGKVAQTHLPAPVATPVATAEPSAKEKSPAEEETKSPSASGAAVLPTPPSTEGEPSRRASSSPAGDLGTTTAFAATAFSPSPQPSGSTAAAAASPVLPTTSAATHQQGPSAGELQANMLKRLVEEAQLEFRQQMHTDIVNMHIDMVRGFTTMRAEMAEMLQQHLGQVQAILQENERLRDEVRRLKNLY